MGARGEVRANCVGGTRVEEGVAGGSMRGMGFGEGKSEDVVKGRRRCIGAGVSYTVR
jgi:hypothetical protein